MSGLSINDAGNAFDLVIDDFSGGKNADCAPDAIGLNEFVELKNLLTHLPGPARKRGAITNAGANSNDVNGSTGVLAFYDGPLRSGTTYRTYVGLASTGGTTTYKAIYDASSAASTLLATATIPLPVSKCPTVDGVLFIAGREAGNSTYPNRATGMMAYGGSTAASAYSDGTITLGANDTNVAGAGTAWTSSMEGRYLDTFFGSEPATHAQPYLIKKVVSATQLILARPYGGTQAGAGRSYQIIPRTFVFANSTSSGVYAKVASSAWGRVVVGSTREPLVSSFNDYSPEYPSRIRWSGIAGSTEGYNGSVCGAYAFDSDGYLDLQLGFGEILAMSRTKNSLVVFQESGMTNIFGSPTYDGVGSLDASDVYPGVAINGGFAFESTPIGVFFYDKNVGPCRFDGSRVERLADKRLTRLMLASHDIKYVGYYDGKVLFSSDTTAAIFVYDTALDAWSQHTPPAAVKCLVSGRVENNEDVVGLAGGVRVVNLANMIDNPGDAATDYDSTAIAAELKTRKFGDTNVLLRPREIYVTYKCTDLSTTNPYLKRTIYTGLDGDENTSASASDNTVYGETTKVVTKLEGGIQMLADPQIQIKLELVNGAGVFELHRVHVRGDVEGLGVSSG